MLLNILFCRKDSVVHDVVIGIHHILIQIRVQGATALLKFWHLATEIRISSWTPDFCGCFFHLSWLLSRQTKMSKEGSSTHVWDRPRAPILERRDPSLASDIVRIYFRPRILFKDLCGCFMLFCGQHVNDLKCLIWNENISCFFNLLDMEIFLKRENAVSRI